MASPTAISTPPKAPKAGGHNPITVTATVVTTASCQKANQQRDAENSVCSAWSLPSPFVRINGPSYKRTGRASASRHASMVAMPASIASVAS